MALRLGQKTQRPSEVPGRAVRTEFGLQARSLSCGYGGDGAWLLQADARKDRLFLVRYGLWPGDDVSDVWVDARR